MLYFSLNPMLIQAKGQTWEKDVPTATADLAPPKSQGWGSGREFPVFFPVNAWEKVKPSIHNPGPHRTREAAAASEALYQVLHEMGSELEILS